jgi:hypothetical protein
MRVITWNWILATWLLLSAFLLSHSFASMVLTAVAAVVVATASLASGGRPGVRYVIAVVAIALAIGALLLPDVSGIARLSNGLVAAVLFLVSLVSPRHGAGEPAEAAPAAPRA